MTDLSCDIICISHFSFRKRIILELFNTVSPWARDVAQQCSACLACVRLRKPKNPTPSALNTVSNRCSLIYYVGITSKIKEYLIIFGNV
jgi:hypothetical protein